MDLINRLEKIEEKVKSLQATCSSLEVENAKLTAEQRDFESRLRDKDNIIINLEEQNKIAKLAGGLATESNPSELKSQIEELIIEIDQCIKIVKR